jgi:hypothetical protein
LTAHTKEKTPSIARMAVALSRIDRSIPQVKDQRELVQDQGHADPHAHPGEALPAQRGRPADRGKGANDQEDQARHSTVDMRPGRRYLITEGAAAIADEPGDCARRRKGHHEGQETQAKRQFPGRDNVPMPPRAHVPMLAELPGGCAGWR